MYSLNVCSRGTASKVQMDDNLRYALQDCDFQHWHTAALDQLDGLSIQKGACLYYDFMLLLCDSILQFIVCVGRLVRNIVSYIN
jgi:hypothetical protein